MRSSGLLATLLVACIQSGSVICDDGTVCPAGTSCRALTDPSSEVCASPDQLTACDGATTGDPCTTPNIADGRCYDGVCLLGGCGNGRLDPGEVCDDGNATVGDGCSFECKSNETCGNGIVDPIRLDTMGSPIPNEQCDDGNTLGHDGCSGTCASETAHWDQLGYGLVDPLVGASGAYDSARDRVVMFGGEELENPNFPVPPLFLDGTFEWDGHAWTRIGVAFSPPARSGAAMAYDATRHRTVLFGGSAVGTFGDTWEWDGTTWTQTTVPGPPSRSGHGMAYDSIRKKVVLFGGSDQNGTFLDDVWEFDGAWTQVTLPNPPVARRDAVLAFDPTRGVIVVAGGDIGSGLVGDTCEYDGATWRHVTATPMSMVGAAIAFDPGSRTLVTFGGSFSTSAYAWDGQTWTAIASGPTPGRIYAMLATDAARGQVVMYGGEDNNILCMSCLPNLGDTWLFHAGAWTSFDQQDQTAPVLEEQAVAFDPLRGRIVEFGGMMAATGGDSDTTWTLDHGVWIPLATTVPSARHGAAMAYDAAHQQFVLFGGTTTVPQADTWLFDGVSTWTQPPPTAVPPPRTGHGMAYDPGAERVVMYGGADDTATWEWDGSTWTPHATTGVPALDNPTLAYDVTLHHIVMFGGLDRAGGTASGTTWSWDHATRSWTELAPVSTPGGRSTMMAPLAARHALIAFDGAIPFTSRQDTISFQPIDETWEWTGELWREVLVAGRPPERKNHIVAPLPDGSGILVHGGENSDAGTPTTLEDVWQLRWTAGTPYEACTTDVDLDGDGLGGCADPDCWFACTPLCPPGATCDPTTPRCGDGACNAALENCRICPGDCGACAAECGDSFCDAPETHESCPGDCP